MILLPNRTTKCHAFLSMCIRANGGRWEFVLLFGMSKLEKTDVYTHRLTPLVDWAQCLGLMCLDSFLESIPM